jgi:hypothetical protein
MKLREFEIPACHGVSVALTAAGGLVILGEPRKAILLLSMP